MIFIANVLVMNGGTTFLIRLIRERSRRGQKSVILLLTDLIDERLYETLKGQVEIIPLSKYLLDRGKFSRGISRTFLPFQHKLLLRDISKFGTHVHAMGVFGMIFGLRLTKIMPSLKLTTGIYHQNEFLYKPSNFFFPHKIIEIFRSTPHQNVIFFNETTRDNYSEFYCRNDLIHSPMLPIGIDISNIYAQKPEEILGNIVSIGNLFPYKIYNKHMIGVVAALRDRFPEIKYDIYGVGPMENELRDLANRLGASDRVTLHGALDYTQLREVVAACDLFVGSGTALIEAAAVGRPAMIGIESIETPDTYGYLSDARGYSYNENMPDVPKFPIISLVERLFSDAAHWQTVAAACAAKAQEFSISVTADGFDAAGAAAEPIPFKLRSSTVARMAMSAVAMRTNELLGRSEPFGKRHNQSY